MRPFPPIYLRFRLLAAVVLAAMAGLAVGANGASASGTVLVDSTGDADSRDGVVTLREAILIVNGDLLISALDAGEADNVGGTPSAQSADTIQFSSAVFPDASPQEIGLLSELPWMDSDGDTVDGVGAGVLVTSVSGLDGCLTLQGNMQVVRKLHIDNCARGIWVRHDDNLIADVVLTNNGSGILLDGGSSTIESSKIGTDSTGTLAMGNGTGIFVGGGGGIIGGPIPGDGNVISGNSGSGIIGSAGSGVVVQGNLIGTASDGESPLSNGGPGIAAQTESVRTWTILDNVISGNAGHGIDLDESSDWVIRGNRIGVTRSGTPMGNGGSGIYRGAVRNGVTIGGPSPGNANIIAANAGHGISIDVGGQRSRADIFGNYIGVLDDGSPMANGLSGVYVDARWVTVGGVGFGEGNTIAHNTQHGVEIEWSPDGIENYVRGNSIYSNGLSGIRNLADGLNHEQPPIIQSAGPNIAGAACGGCTIDVYSDDENEGRLFEGTTIADGSGSWSFVGPLTGPSVTATASDLNATFPVHTSTSEFASPLLYDNDQDNVADAIEPFCGSDPSDGGSIPERVDAEFAGIDDDGNDGADEALPAGADDYDCDGDGYIGSVEDHVFSYVAQTNSDQKACQEYDAGFSVLDPNQTSATPSLRWPSDFRTGSVPDSTNRINILDLSTFVVPVRYLGTDVGTHPADVRWDISPGKGPLAVDINILDLAAFMAPGSLTGAPPMLGGVRAFLGPVCPWPE